MSAIINDDLCLKFWTDVIADGGLKILLIGSIHHFLVMVGSILKFH